MARNATAADVKTAPFSLELWPDGWSPRVTRWLDPSDRTEVETLYRSVVTALTSDAIRSSTAAVDGALAKYEIEVHPSIFVSHLCYVLGVPFEVTSSVQTTLFEVHKAAEKLSWIDIKRKRAELLCEEWLKYKNHLRTELDAEFRMLPLTRVDDYELDLSQRITWGNLWTNRLWKMLTDEVHLRTERSFPLLGCARPWDKALPYTLHREMPLNEIPDSMHIINIPMNIALFVRRLANAAIYLLMDSGYALRLQYVSPVSAMYREVSLGRLMGRLMTEEFAPLNTGLYGKMPDPIPSFIGQAAIESAAMSGDVMEIDSKHSEPESSVVVNACLRAYLTDMNDTFLWEMTQLRDAIRGINPQDSVPESAESDKDQLFATMTSFFSAFHTMQQHVAELSSELRRPEVEADYIRYGKYLLQLLIADIAEHSSKGDEKKHDVILSRLASEHTNQARTINMTRWTDLRRMHAHLLKVATVFERDLAARPGTKELLDKMKRQLSEDREACLVHARRIGLFFRQVSEESSQASRLLHQRELRFKRRLMIAGVGNAAPFSVIVPSDPPQRAALDSVRKLFYHSHLLDYRSFWDMAAKQTRPELSGVELGAPDVFDIRLQEPTASPQKLSDRIKELIRRRKQNMGDARATEYNPEGKLDVSEEAIETAMTVAYGNNVNWSESRVLGRPVQKSAIQAKQEAKRSSPDSSNLLLFAAEFRHVYAKRLEFIKEDCHNELKQTATDIWTYLNLTAREERDTDTSMHNEREREKENGLKMSPIEMTQELSAVVYLLFLDKTATVMSKTASYRAAMGAI